MIRIEDCKNKKIKNKVSFVRDKLSKDVQIFWDAYECEDAGDYESAVKLYKKAITLGSAESCINLGNYYINHHGNNKVAEALTLYAMASDMGHDGGAWNLYNHHKDSDDIISQYWLKKSAQLGNEDAQLLLKTQIHIVSVNK